MNSYERAVWSRYSYKEQLKQIDSMQRSRSLISSFHNHENFLDTSGGAVMWPFLDLDLQAQKRQRLGVRTEAPCYWFWSSSREGIIYCSTSSPYLGLWKTSWPPETPRFVSLFWCSTIQSLHVALTPLLQRCSAPRRQEILAAVLYPKINRVSRYNVSWKMKTIQKDSKHSKGYSLLFDFVFWSVVVSLMGSDGTDSLQVPNGTPKAGDWRGTLP